MFSLLGVYFPLQLPFSPIVLNKNLNSKVSLYMLVTSYIAPFVNSNNNSIFCPTLFLQSFDSYQLIQGCEKICSADNEGS